MAISKIKEVVSWIKGHNHLPAERREAHIREWAEEIIDECAKIAQETPTGRQIGEILKLKEQIQ